MAGLVGIFLDILGPVFVVIGLGAVAGRVLDVRSEALARLAYWVVGPAFMFHALATARLGPGVLGRMVAALTLASAGALLVAWLVTMRRPRPERAAVVTNSVYGNVGNYGLAVVAFTYGDDALALGAIGLVTINTIGVIVGVATAHSGWRSVRMAATSPLTLAIAPAAVINAADIELPPLIGRPVGLVAQAMIPLMLLALGIQLQQMTRPRLDVDVVASIVLKLLVHPAFAVVAVAAVGLTGPPAGTVVLMAAMPTAVFAVVLAIEQKTTPELTSTAIVLGTLASLLTLPGIIALVQ